MKSRKSVTTSWNLISDVPLHGSISVWTTSGRGEMLDRVKPEPGITDSVTSWDLREEYSLPTNKHAIHSALGHLHWQLRCCNVCADTQTHKHCKHANRNFHSVNVCHTHTLKLPARDLLVSCPVKTLLFSNTQTQSLSSYHYCGRISTHPNLKCATWFIWHQIFTITLIDRDRDSLVSKC